MIGIAMSYINKWEKKNINKDLSLNIFRENTEMFSLDFPHLVNA